MSAQQEGPGRRRYVRVRCEIAEDGQVVPLVIMWALGVSYEITKVATSTSWACSSTGRGRRYTIWIGGHMTYLYWDTVRWYVREKVYPKRELTSGAASSAGK